MLKLGKQVLAHELIMILRFVLVMGLFFMHLVTIAQERIPMKEEMGVYTVPCEVNGLRLRFVFDTGASDVVLSATEALFMLKNDYLEESDIQEKKSYLLADGTIAENTIVMLKEIKIGSKVLKNIKASIAKNASAPLLLGQSVIKLLQPWYIENEELVLGLKKPQGKEQKQSLEESWNDYIKNESLTADILYKLAMCDFQPAIDFINKNPFYMEYRSDIDDDTNLRCHLDLIEKGIYSLCPAASNICTIHKIFDHSHDWSLGLKLLKLGASHDNAISQAYLAKVYDPAVEKSFYFYPGFLEDKTKSYDLYKKAIAKGSITAMYYYANSLLHQPLVTSEEERVAINHMINAGNKGYTDASHDLMIMYFHGTHVPRNYDQSIYWAQQYIDAVIDKTEGYAYLGYCYIAKNMMDKAFYLLMESVSDADKGISPPVNVYYWLGYCCYYGEGTKIDYKRAKFYFEKFLQYKYDDYDNPYIESSVNLNLYFIHYDGKGVIADKKLAISYLQKAAGLDNEIAETLLGTLYFDGESLPYDTERAVMYLERAAKKEYADAYHMLGVIYSTTKSKFNINLAIKYYKMAMEKGYPDSYYNMGIIYEEGIGGVAKNFKLAEDYFRKAADLGYEDAKQRLKSYENN